MTFIIAASPVALCKACGKEFRRSNTMRALCGAACIDWFADKTEREAKKKAKAAAKAERALIRVRRESIKPRSKWLSEAQAAFNAWIRARDEAAGLPCISCDRHHRGSYDAGHYLTVGARPELRFDHDNVHRQCVPCNRYLHGNLILYRVELVKRIGLEAVERLEGPHPPAKWPIDELRCIRDGYRILTKQLKEGQ